MITWNTWSYYLDSCLGHIMLVVYLFAIMDEPAAWRQAARRLPVLLLSPLAATGIWMLVSGKMTVLLIGSFSNLFCCTLWAKWAWRIPSWRAFSYVCVAGMMQGLTSSLRLFRSLVMVLSVEWLVSTVDIAWAMLLALGLAFFLRRAGFGVLFRSFLEEVGKVRAVVFLFLLLVLVEGAFLLGVDSFSLREELDPKLYLAYDIMVSVTAALVMGGIVSVAQRMSTNRRLQAQRDIIAQQMLYERSLEEVRQEMRSFRHDYKNILSGMSQQAKEGETNVLSRELEKLEAGFDRRLGEKIQESTQVGNLRIPQVRSLLLAKLVDMEEKGVECRLEVLYPVETVNMDAWDFVRCVGVLVDNAVEASLETEKPWVEIVLLQQGTDLELRVGNTWTGRTDPARIWNEGYSTKGKGRGTGLSGLQRILRDYPGAFVSASWTEEAFVQELTVPGEAAGKR